MKAIVHTKYGSPDHLHLQEVQKPTPKSDEVLIKVKAASINAWDYDVVIGSSFIIRLVSGALFSPKIKVLGCDVAGVVEEVGNEVKILRPGDEVFGDLSGEHWGGFGEYTCAKEEEVAIKSPKMSFVEAAATPQAALLALQGLRKHGEIKAEDKVLINGAGGGVGPFAIQLARMSGAEITGVDRSEKLDFMKLEGADHVIDFKEEDFTSSEKSYDVILDNEVTRTSREYKRVLSDKGEVIMLGGHKLLRVFVNALFGGKKVNLLALKPLKKDLEYLTQLFNEGKIKPIVDQVFPLEKTPEAFRHFGSGLAKGKVVITQE